MLPSSQMILIRLAPCFQIRGDRLAADLDGQALIFDIRCRPTYESMRGKVEVLRYIVIQPPHLSRWSGMRVEDYFRAVPVDIAPCLDHHMLADLPAVIAESVRVLAV